MEGLEYSLKFLKALEKKINKENLLIGGRVSTFGNIREEGLLFHIIDRVDTNNNLYMWASNDLNNDRFLKLGFGTGKDWNPDNSYSENVSINSRLFDLEHLEIASEYALERIKLHLGLNSKSKKLIYKISIPTGNMDDFIDAIDKDTNYGDYTNLVSVKDLTFDCFTAISFHNNQFILYNEKDVESRTIHINDEIIDKKDLKDRNLLDFMVSKNNEFIEEEKIKELDFKYPLTKRINI